MGVVMYPLPLHRDAPIAPPASFDAKAPFRRGGIPLLACRNICKAFGAVQALSNVDFEVFAGEVVALVGDNGAGKSTLIKAISGIQPADDGELLFEGRPVRIQRAGDATGSGSRPSKDLALCDNLDTVANLFLGREMVEAQLPWRDCCTYSRSRKWNFERARSWTTHVTTISSVRRPVSTLSGGQRQAVAIARATLWDAKLVILDEPTAALGVQQTATVLAMIAQLREHGLGVVVITHNLDVVFEVADRIVVLYVGRNNGSFEKSDTRPATRCREAMVGSAGRRRGCVAAWPSERRHRVDVGAAARGPRSARAAPRSRLCSPPGRPAGRGGRALRS